MLGDMALAQSRQPLGNQLLKPHHPLIIPAGPAVSGYCQALSRSKSNVGRSTYGRLFAVSGYSEGCGGEALVTAMRNYKVRPHAGGRCVTVSVRGEVRAPATHGT